MLRQFQAEKISYMLYYLKTFLQNKASTNLCTMGNGKTQKYLSYKRKTSFFEYVKTLKQNKNAADAYKKAYMY